MDPRNCFMADGSVKPCPVRELRSEMERLRGIIDRAIRSLSADPDSTIPWELAGEILMSYCDGWQMKADGAIEEANQLRILLAWSNGTFRASQAEAMLGVPRGGLWELERQEMQILRIHEQAGEAQPEPRTDAIPPSVIEPVPTRPT